MTDTPYEKNTREQYEALGRFVESFEAMVHEARTCCCFDLLQYGLAPQQKRLVAIPLYYHALGAKAVFDIFRAVFIETIRDEDYQTKHAIGPTEIDNFSSVLSQINGHYDDLCSKRNNLLHGTWFVGYRSAQDDDASKFHVYRQKLSRTGLSAVSLPSTAPELLTLRDQCEEVRWWISTVHACLPHRDIKPFKECFEYRGQQWHLLWGSPDIPLPKR